MSEEVIIADTIETGVVFVISIEGVQAHLHHDAARVLRDELNEFLGADKQPGTIGITFPRGTDEPALPIGTRLIDNEGDVVERVEDGWKWVQIDGDKVSRPSVYSWDTITNEYEHKWFQVVA